jgi:hypothetical protein
MSDQAKKRRRRQKRLLGYQSLESRRLLAAMPAWIEPNLGQYAADVPAVFRSSAYFAALAPDRATLHLPDPWSAEIDAANLEPVKTPAYRELIVELLGADAAAPRRMPESVTASVDYLFGNDPGNWWTDIPAHDSLWFDDVYASIDVGYRGDDQGTLEQVFRIRPRGDVEQIRLAFPTARSVHIDASGDLRIDTGFEELLDSAPRAFQWIDSRRITVPVHYRVLEHNIVGFALGAYDPQYPVEIDPLLTRTQFAGGSGSDALTDMILDAAGNRYFAGRTFSADFATKDPSQAANNGQGDAFIVQHDRFGSLRKATFFGGSAFDTIESLAFDAAGRVVAAGWTASPNFPTQAAGQPNFGGGPSDGILAVFDAGLNLVHSTFVGGQGTDRLLGVAADSAGRVVTAGQTDDASFPSLNSLRAFGGGTDLVVSLFDGDGSLLASTFWGGSATDMATAVAVHATGIYVTGHSTSADFPTLFPIQAALAGQDDVILVKFAPGLDSALFSTYIGDADTDQAADIALDALGNAIVIGSSGSIGSSSNGDAVVRKIAASGSSVLFTARIGGTAKDTGDAVTVDRDGRIHIAGTRFAGSLFFPITADAFQPAYGGGLTDAFVATLDANGVVRFSSNLGGSSDDSGQAIGVEFSGDLVVAGNTRSADFPRGGSQPVPRGGGSDIFLSTIIENTRFMDFAGLQQRAFALSQQLFVRPEPIAIDQLDPPKPGEGRDAQGMVFQESLLVQANNVLDGLPAPLDKFYVGVRPRAALNKLALDVYTDHDLNGQFDRRLYDQQNVDYSHPDIQPAIEPSLIPDAGRILSEIFIGREQGPNSFPIFLNLGANAYGRFNSFDPQTVGSSFRVSAHKVLNANEDFPLIREMYVRILDQQRANILALVDSGAATAALSIELIPGPSTVMTVDAMWYPRALILADNPDFALIAYSSLFWKDERDTPDESDDEAHDLDHLVIGFDTNSDGVIDEFIDRQLNNPQMPNQIDVTRFEDLILGKPLLMALENRDRDPAHYSRYATAEYARRASYEVQIVHSDVPLAVRLFEAATGGEALDNIVVAAVIKQNLLQPQRVEDGYRVQAVHRAFFPPDNHLPVISPLNDVHATTAAPLPEMTFTVADVETPAAQLIVSAVSSNPLLIPNQQVVISGDAGLKTLNMAALPGATGTAQIIVTVQDEAGGTSETDFLVTVAAPWQNPRNRLDVNDDGIVNPFDALLVIKDLREHGSRTLPAPPLALPRLFLDTSGDNRLTPFDALMILSHIARRTGGGEGETENGSDDATRLSMTASAPAASSRLALSYSYAMVSSSRRDSRISLSPNGRRDPNDEYDAPMSLDVPAHPFGLRPPQPPRAAAWIRSLVPGAGHRRADPARPS